MAGIMHYKLVIINLYRRRLEENCDHLLCVVVVLVYTLAIASVELTACGIVPRETNK